MPNPEEDGFERLYLVDEIAEYMHVTKETVREWIKEGRLPAARAGRSYRVTDTDLKAFLVERFGLEDHLE